MQCFQYGENRIVYLTDLQKGITHASNFSTLRRCNSACS